MRVSDPMTTAVVSIAPGSEPMTLRPVTVDAGEDIRVATQPMVNGVICGWRRDKLMRGIPAGYLAGLYCGSHSPMRVSSYLLVFLAQTAAPVATAVNAPVVVDGDTLFVLHGGLGPFGAAERASALAGQLAVVLNDSAGPRPTIRVVEGVAHATILAGDQVLLAVLESDAAPDATTPALQARRYADVLRLVVASRRGGAGGRAAIAALVGILAGGAGVLMWRLRMNPRTAD